MVQTLTNNDIKRVLDANAFDITRLLTIAKDIGTDFCADEFSDITIDEEDIIDHILEITSILKIDIFSKSKLFRTLLYIEFSEDD